MTGPGLTRGEWRALGIGTLTAACAALATGIVTWGFEEAKRIVAARREAKRKATEQSPTGESP